MTVAGIARDDQRLLAPIQHRLRRVIWRARAAVALRGVLSTLAAALIAILAAMGLAARFPPEEAWQDYVLTLLWLAVTAAAAWLTLIRPLARSFTLAGIARVVEQRHPELHERISSTLELLASSDAPEIRGSEALIHALATEAVRDVRTVQPRREISFRKARLPLLVLAAAALVVAALLAAYPRPAGRLLAKMVVPYLNIANFYAEDLLVTPGAKVLPVGERLEVKVAIRSEQAQPKVRNVEFRARRPGQADEAVRMSALPDGSFGYTTDPLIRSMQYRVRAGRAVTQYFPVTVVPRPALERIEVGYAYPAYMGRHDVPPTPDSGDVSAPVGTVATVHLRLNKPVAEARLLVNDEPAELSGPDPAEPTAYSFRLALGRESAGRWRLLLTDEYGHTGGLIEHRIEATPDNPPAANITGPDPQPDKIRPTDRVPLAVAVSDDFGVSKAELLVSVDGREAKAIPIPAAAIPMHIGTGRTFLEAALNVDLAALDLTGARRVGMQVRAWDNLPESLGGPQEGLSAARTFELDVQAKSYVFQVQLAMDLQIRETLERIYRELLQAKKISEPLRRSMPATKTLTQDTTGKIDALRKHLGSAEADTRQLAEVTAGGTYPKLSETLATLADNHVGKARELAGLIKITDQQKQRAALADEADFQVDRAIAIVSELLKQFQVWTELARQAIELEELARRQQELAAQKGAQVPPEAAAATQPAEQLELSPRDWEQAQRQVARDVGEMVRQTPGALREALAPQGRQTTDLARAARQLQTQQQALMQNTTEAQQIRTLQSELAKLAAEQAQLARQIGQFQPQAAAVQPTTQPVAQAHQSAGQAAQTLTTTQPALAVPQQAAAAQALEQASQEAAEELRRHAAAQLAAAAERLAQQQEQLARRSQAAGEQLAQAQAAEAAAQQHTAQQQQTLAQVAGRLADLARRQAALARQAQQLEAAGQPPAPARPAQQMHEAARSLQRGDPGAAAPQAQQAAGQAEKMAQEFVQRIPAARQAADQAAKDAASEQVKGLQAAAQKAQQQAQGAAEQAARLQQVAAGPTQQAQAADQQATKLEQAATQAAQKAQAAAEEAKKLDQAAAEASEEDRAAAQQAAAAGQQRAAETAMQARTAREGAAAARAQAQQAAQRAQPSQQAAAAAQQTAAQAAQRAAAARQTAEAPAQAARQAAARAQQAQAHTTEGQRIAGEQAALAKEIAQAAQQEAPNVAQAAQAAQQAAAQAARARQAQQQAVAQTQGAPQSQQQLAQQVGQLRSLAQQATPQAQGAMRQHDPGRNMELAAQELGRERPVQAAPAQDAAARQLRRIAQAARQPRQPASPESANQVAQAAQDLARRQRELQRRTSDLTSRLAVAESRRDQQELTRLRAEQEQLAREAARLSDDVRETAPQPDRIDTRAARAAAEAAQELAQSHLPSAAEAGRRAAGEMGELSGRLGHQGEPGEHGEGEPGEHGQGEPGEHGQGPGEPGQGRGQPHQGQGGPGQPGEGRSGQVQASGSQAQEPQQVAGEQGPTESQRRAELAGRAGDLARRQERVAGEVEALAQRQPEQLLASRQGRIAEQTQQAQEATELVRDHVGDLLPGQSAQELAQQAAGALQQAGQSQQQAGQAMQAGRLGQSMPPQQASAAALAQAAQALQQLGQMVAEQARRAPPPPPPPQQDVPPGQLAQAHEAARSAAQSQSESDAARAARLLAALAGQASQRATSMGIMPLAGIPFRGMGGWNVDSRTGVGLTGLDLQPGELEELGISPADWTRLPGRLRDQVLQAARRGGPEEYRPLIKRYFQAIARLGAGTGQKQEEEK